jgi:hypothetical protein
MPGTRICQKEITGKICYIHVNCDKARTDLTLRVSQRGFPEKSKLVQHAHEESHMVGWDEARILEIKVTEGIGNIKNRPIWHAQPIPSSNSVWTFPPPGSPT